MSDGIATELPELIALRRYAHQVRHHPKRQVQRFGNHLSKLRGRGMDFSEVRHYQAGDEIRHMEWRVTARTGRPHVKLYHEERERPAIILADFNPSMFFGTRIAFKSVIAARLAAIIAWTAIGQGDRVGGLLCSGDQHAEFVPRSRDEGILALLAGLSQYTKTQVEPYESQTASFSKTLLRLRRVTRPGSLLILISDFYQLDEESERHLNRLRLHNDILAYHIADPLECLPPKSTQYAITNGQQDLLLDTTATQVYKAYQQHCEHRMTALQSLFHKMQIQYVQVTAEQDLPQLVRQTYPRRSHD